MGYSALPEKLWPGEAEHAWLPWGFMGEEEKRRLTTEPQKCIDCGMSDQPHVAAYRLCSYCHDLRRLRRVGWPMRNRPGR